MSTQLTNDIDALEKLAQAATPGPWEQGGSNGGNSGCVYCDDATGCAVAKVSLEYSTKSGTEIQANGAFIAAANPAAILSLINRLRMAEAALRAQGEPTMRITGMDEYGPMFEWHKHWTEFPIGTQFSVIKNDR